MKEKKDGLTNIGIIGCGAAANRYYTPALRKNLRLVENLYLVDNNLDQAAKLSEEIGKGEIYDDYRNIIDKVQGVIIAVPHFLHYSISSEFLRAGVNVLCEKPLAESVMQVKELNKIANEKNVAICVNNTVRMFPSFRKIKEIIDRNQIGQIKSIDFRQGSTFAWPSSTGFYVDPKVSAKGVLLDLGPHVIDIICWWLNEKLVLVDYKDDSFGGPESVARIKAQANGCNVDVLLNRFIDLENRFKIIGEYGTVEGHLFGWDQITVKLKSGEIVNEKFKTSAKSYSEFVFPIVDNFLKVIGGKEIPLISGNDVQPSIEFIENCYIKRSRFELPWYQIPRTLAKTKSKVLVTGASGFIGGRIIEYLYMENCRKIRAGIRQWSSAARLGRFPVDIVLMDLMNNKEIEERLEGVTEIIHCAKGPGGVTVQGTRNLLESALKNGIKRFVHLSTAEVYGDITGEINEDEPFNYTGNEYNQSKIDAEKAVWEFYHKGLPVTIVRPSIVYGPFSKAWTIHFAKMLIAGKWGIYENYGEGYCNLIYIDDLVKAILLSIDNENAIGHAFNVSGPEVITWNAYFKKYNDMMMLPPLKIIKEDQANFKTAVTEPIRILGGIVQKHFFGPVKKVAETFDFAKRVMIRTENLLKTTPSSDELKLFSKNVIFTCKKAKEKIQFSPSISVDEGLTKTIEWLKHQGVLRRN